MKKQKFTILILLACVYLIICGLYSHHKTKNELKLLESYVNFISPHVWQLDETNTKKIIETLFRNYDVIEVTIYDEYGNLFVKMSKDINNFIKHLLKVRIFYKKIYEFSLTNYTHNFGKVVITVLRTDVYFYLYSLLLLTAIYYAWRSYLNLKIMKEKLEIVNKELEDTIAELHSTIEELEATQDQLITSEKLATLGRFVAGIAHDLNTPLGIIFTSLSELKEQLTKLKEAYEEGKISKILFENFLNDSEELIELMERNTKRLIDLVRSLKNVSADTKEKPVEFSLEDVIKDVLGALNPKLRKLPIEISVNCPKDLKIKSYPGPLSQVFMNLIENSIVHAFENGTKPGKIKINVYDHENEIVIVYKDTGRGMDKETKTKAFEPFYTTKSAHGGTGLGLYIVYTLTTERLKGTITVDSKPNYGVEFIITLPKDITEYE